MARARSAREPSSASRSQFIEPSEGADRESALRSLAARGVDLVIGVGFIFGPDLERLAVQFPNVKFAGIDYCPSPTASAPLPNLAGLRFREHEGSFLVGAIAGLLTRTKIVGFVGGMKIPLIRKFEAGYEAGVKHVCPTCRVLVGVRGHRAEGVRRSAARPGARVARSTARAPTSSFTRPARPATACSRRRGQRKARAIGVDSRSVRGGAVLRRDEHGQARRRRGGRRDQGRHRGQVPAAGCTSSGSRRTASGSSPTSATGRCCRSRWCSEGEARSARRSSRARSWCRTDEPMAEPMIEAELAKRYGACEVAARARSSRCARGTVHALVGENGAGKSTLVKILAGVLRGDRGDARGRRRARSSSRRWTRAAARAAGIGIVQQHGASARDADRRRERGARRRAAAAPAARARRRPRRRCARSATRSACRSIRGRVPADALARRGAARGDRRGAAPGREAARSSTSRPRCSTPVEVEGLLATLRTLAAAGTTIVLVTHKLDEVPRGRRRRHRAARRRDGRDVRAHGDGARPRSTSARSRARWSARSCRSPTRLEAPAADARPALVLDARRCRRGCRRSIAGGARGRDRRRRRRRRQRPARARARDRGARARDRRGPDRRARRRRARRRAARLAAGLAHIPEDRHHGGLDPRRDGRREPRARPARRDRAVRGSIARASRRNAVARIAELDIRPADRRRARARAVGRQPAEGRRRARAVAAAPARGGRGAADARRRPRRGRADPRAAARRGDGGRRRARDLRRSRRAARAVPPHRRAAARRDRRRARRRGAARGRGARRHSAC